MRPFRAVDTSPPVLYSKSLTTHVHRSGRLSLGRARYEVFVISICETTAVCFPQPLSCGAEQDRCRQRHVKFVSLSLPLGPLSES